MAALSIAGVEKIRRTDTALLHTGPATDCGQRGKTNHLKNKTLCIYRGFLVYNLPKGIPTEKLSVRYLFLSFAVLLLSVELILVRPNP